MRTNWPTKKLEKVCKVVKSGIIPFNGEKEYIDTSSIQNFSIIKSKLITYKKRPSRANMEAKMNDVLVAKMADTTKVYLATLEDEKKRIFSTGFFILKPEKELIEPKFLFLYCSSNLFQNLKDESAHGATQKALNDEKLKKYFEIPLPPLKIQKQIVAKIEELFEKIDKAKELRQKTQEETKQVFSSVLQEIFSKTEKRWEKKNLGDKSVANITSGGTPKRGVKKYYENGIIPWLKSGELNDNENIIDSEEHITEIALKESSAKIFPVNSVLIAMYGATVGKVGIVKNPIATNQAIAGIQPNEKILNYKFLFNYLVWKRNFLIWRSFGGAQPNISQIVIKKLEIPLPPLPEQKKIVAYLDGLREKVEKLKQLQEEQLEDLEELKKSILETAFKGKL